MANLEFYMMDIRPKTIRSERFNVTYGKGALKIAAKVEKKYELENRGWDNHEWRLVGLLSRARRRHYFFRLPMYVTTWPRSAATNRLKLRSSAGCVSIVFGEFVAMTRQAAE
jgi:hypothetical protein